MFPVLEVLDSPWHTETGRAQPHTDLFPSCAVTRAQAHKNDDISLFDSVLMPVLSGEAETEAAAASSNKSAVGRCAPPTPTQMLHLRTTVLCR